MDALSGGFVRWMLSVIEFLSYPGVLGLGAGLLAGSGLQQFWKYWGRRQDYRRTRRFIEESVGYNKAIIERNIELLGRDIEKLPSISLLEPLHELLPSGAELLMNSRFSSHPQYHHLWMTLKKIDHLSGQIRALSCEILEIKRTIKSETRTEVLRVELIPYLRDFNTMAIVRLTEMGLECKRATLLLHEGKGKSRTQ